MSESGMPKPVTMADIARRAAVSRPTVSRVLRNDPRISATTRERVLKAADALDYIPNPAFDLLAAQRWGSEKRGFRFALAYLDLGHFNREIFEGAVRRAETLGYRLERVSLVEFGSMEALDRGLYTRGVRGLLVPVIRERDAFPNLHWERYSSVACGVDFQKPPMHVVRPDVFTKIDETWRLLRERGYRRIGVVLPVEARNPLDVRRIGVSLYHQYQSGLRATDRIPLWTGHFSEMHKLPKWFARHRPEAVIAGVAGVLSALQVQQGMNGSCAFVSLVTEPKSGISGFDSRHRLIGVTAMNLLDQQIKHNKRGLPKDPLTILIPPKWIEGRTCPRRDGQRSTA